MQRRNRNHAAYLLAALLTGLAASPTIAQERGVYDVFVVSLTPDGLYWNLTAGGGVDGPVTDPVVTPSATGAGVIDTTTPLGGVAWAWGGVERDDGVADPHPFFQPVTISHRGEPAYFISAVLDTLTPPHVDSNFPSFGMIIMEIVPVTDGIPGAPVLPIWIASPDSSASVVTTDGTFSGTHNWVQFAPLGPAESDLQLAGVNGVGALLPAVGDGNGDRSDDGYDVTIMTDVMETWDSYTLPYCPPDTLPTFTETYLVHGDANNIPWSWRIRSQETLFEDFEDLNVPGVPAGGMALEVAEAFADSINATATAQGCGLGEIRAQARTFLGSVILSVTTGGNAPFDLYVGAALGDPDCLVTSSLPACSFNPSIEEVPLPGQDCNGNGFDDFIDIAAGESLDLNENGIPDECECVCDWNRDGILNSVDFFAFVGAFINDSDADFNGDGITNSNDFFEFLNCFLNPPTDCT